LVRRLGAAAAQAVLVAVVVGCGSVAIDGAATGKPSYTAPPPTPTLAPARKPSTTVHGTPYTADDLLEVLAASGSRVPALLRTGPITAAIADALAARLWTYDGEPYGELTLSASCDDDGLRCDLQAKGVPAFAADRDAADFYTFSVEVGTGVLTPAGEPALRGYPAELTPTLDAAARASLGDRLAGTSLLAAQWLAEPDTDAYLLRYGTGDEEADRQVIVRYDRAADTAEVIGE
jgi:hypothetical protein